MPAIGEYLCIWIALLLLCIPTLAHAANETASTELSSTSSNNTPDVSLPTSSIATAASSKLSSPYISETTCGFRTINYITHTLPQQCLKTSWSASTTAVSSETPALGIQDVPGPLVTPPDSQGTINGTQGAGRVRPQNATVSPSSQPGSQESDISSTQPIPSNTAATEAEAETDSPLDNANFLSFEDWKKQNLARIGQSPENVGQGRNPPPNTGNRRRPGINNALDTLGEDSEIELDFSGFGNTGQSDEGTPYVPSGSKEARDPSKTADGEDNVAPSSWALSKDAGKTCKERFNYASFDCAATVLKTNPQCKSSSSVLVEHKDSYMLNECSAQNKFLIVELCEDILVDTIVLANFEFFSSMFRHFRVSISDRYPVKLDRWKVVGTFEARNSRDIQPFLVKEPQIWARYLRVEFLTHYGNEFYCPMSLLRVHGTTMMEEFKRQEEEARGYDDFADPIEEAGGEPVLTADPVKETNEDEKGAKSIPIPVKETEHVLAGSEKKDTAQEASQSEPPSRLQSNNDKSTQVPKHPQDISKVVEQGEATTANITSDAAFRNATAPPLEPQGSAIKAGLNSTSKSSDKVIHTDIKASTKRSSDAPTASSASNVESVKTSIPSSNTASKVSTSDNSTAAAGSSSTVKASIANNSTASPNQHRSSSQTQPAPPNPTTQESFFKSIHKRLQQLEANSTLSLQYIEEQSRILRDAFTKVEKRQLSKTETFLNHLNNTVVQELKSYSSMYDQLWQSTILELESMKEKNQREIGDIGARLTLVADELVWQKRMAVVQSTLLLLCLGLVLFVRSGTLGAQLDVPIVQQIGSKYARIFDTPPGSPESTTRRRKGFRNMWRSDSSSTAIYARSGSGHLSDGAGAGQLSSDAETDERRSPVGIHFSSPTPTSGSSDIAQPRQSSHVLTNGIKHDTRTRDDNEDTSGNESSREPIVLDEEEQAERAQVLATQSGPATPRGSRDSRPSWEEVDRAVDMLKAEAEAGDGEVPTEKRARSPLVRSASYGNRSQSEDSGPGDSDGGMGFV